jgi:quercetin dioxygenase-like cupin family protein
MEIRDSTPSIKGPAEWFTGDVWIDAVARPSGDATASVSAVHFHPGARTAWHSHGTGQTLWVTDGEGLVQTRGEPIVAIRPGDVVWTPADEWHWHGATRDHTMTHLSITDGQATWGDHVTDDEYHSHETH